MQPYIINDARRLADKTGVPIVAFEYRLRSRLGTYTQHGVDRLEDFEWWAKNVEILHSIVVYPRD